jgi:hypothetical protein
LALIFIIASLDFNPFRRVRSVFFTQPELQSVTVDVLEDQIIKIFQIATLEINSRNMTFVDIIPGGFVNPGTLTLIWEYDSTVRFGVRDADRIRMRRVGDIVFVDTSTINIDILEASVKNFYQVREVKSNPIVRRTSALANQIFEAQKEQEAAAAQRLRTDQNLEMARNNFFLQFEAICGGLDLKVVWE